MINKNLQLTPSAARDEINLFSLSVSLFFLMLLAGCSEKGPTDPSPPVPEVEVVTVATRTVPDEPEFIGQTAAFRPVEIRSQVASIIKEIYFTEGRNVKKGDKLYLIDPVPFNAIYQGSKARVAQAQAWLVQVK